MHYIIYKITNLINNKIYIGQHATKNIDDNYLGSGVMIRRAVKKYGKENFKKEILYIFDNFDDMNNMEKELVTNDFSKRKDTYNIIPGGDTIQAYGMMNVAHISDPTNFHLIDSEIYNNNKDEYITPSTGKVSVYNKITGESSSIHKIDFNPEIHKPVFGGIVVQKDGKKQYITKEEFDSGNYSGVHKGKTTVIIKETGEIKHVTSEEYKNNKHLYSMPSTGKVSAKNIETGEYSSITLEEYKKNKHLWKGTTTGEITTYNIETNQWKNIPSECYDKTIHKLALDKKFICYDENENELFIYWGTKKNFKKEFGVPERLWECLLSGEKFYTTYKPHTKFNGWHFKLIDWKKELGV